MKTKVIAFRVTQDEYDALKLWSSQHKLTIADMVNRWMEPYLITGLANLRKERKRLEAKAKREAKKAAADGAQ